MEEKAKKLEANKKKWDQKLKRQEEIVQMCRVKIGKKRIWWEKERKSMGDEEKKRWDERLKRKVEEWNRLGNVRFLYFQKLLLLLRPGGFHCHFEVETKLKVQVSAYNSSL